jgi:hypothetical protein
VSLLADDVPEELGADERAMRESEDAHEPSVTVPPPHITFSAASHAGLRRARFHG